MCALNTIIEHDELIDVESKSTATNLKHMVTHCCFWQYRLQVKAISGGAFVCCAGGMKLAWCIFEPPMPKLNSSNLATMRIQCSWFVGIILGALAAMICVKYVQKHIMHCISGTLLIMGGTVFILMGQYTHAINFSCLVEGLAYGLSLLQLFLTAGEICQRNIRGRLTVSCERITLWLGILLHLLLTQLWYRFADDADISWHAQQLHGLCIVFLGLLTILQSVGETVDSPLLVYRERGEKAAAQALKRLLTAGNERVPARLAWEISLMRTDQQRLLLDVNDTWRLNWLPVVRVLLLRLYGNLALSLPFISAYLTISWQGLKCDMNCSFTIALSGLLGSMLGAHMLDMFGRRKVATCSSLLAGQLIFMVGGICQDLHGQAELHGNLNFTTATLLLLLYEFINCAGSAAVASVYTAEAFGLRTKPLAIGGILCCEALFNIILIVLSLNMEQHAEQFFFTMGWISLFLGILIFFFLPETQALTLGECVNLFRRIRPSF